VLLFCKPNSSCNVKWPVSLKNLQNFVGIIELMLVIYIFFSILLCLTGIKFEKEKDGYLLQQRRYENILDKYDINKYKISSNMIPEENEKLRKKKFNITRYQQAIGTFLYLELKLPSTSIDKEVFLAMARGRSNYIV